MTNEEIQQHIEQNCRHEDGSPAMDEQSFYEGAKWMRDKALSLGAVVGRSEQYFCQECGKQIYAAETDICLACLEKGCGL